MSQDQNWTLHTVLLDGVRYNPTAFQHGFRLIADNISNRTKFNIIGVCAMTKVVPWISRKFNFDFPVRLYPNILARVRGTPPRLEDAARGLSHQQLIMKSGGKWSIQENAGHLLDEEDLHWRRLQEYMAGAESLTPAPYKKIELNHNDRPIGTILSAFDLSRQRQVQLLAKLGSDDFARTAWHARLKVAMRLVDYLLFIAEHDDHHLARMWELRGSDTPQNAAPLT